MTHWQAEDALAVLGDGASLSGFATTTGPLWTHVRPHEAAPLPDDGWKFHISSRAATLPELADRLLPVLLRECCHFKIARSDEVLSRLNSGLRYPAAIGKAVTVYPEQSRVRELGLLLAELLRGHAGPRVLSDRRVDGRAPVYYRYGPFRSRWSSGAQGLPVLRIHGPGGEGFDAAATLAYRQPSWVADPFVTGDGSRPVREAEPELLGGRFRVVEGVFQAAHGNVYRVLDVRSYRPGAPALIVKQARAYVGESAGGTDVRARLRNERRILEACAAVPGIPRFLDHFSHGDDEFLVTTDAGGTHLLKVIESDGAMLPPPANDPAGTAGRAFARLAAALGDTLHALHRRGVVMRDLTPRNIVLRDGRPSIIDFGISALDGFHLPGGTPGFAPPEQLADEDPPRVEDDHYALGMVLAHAATGVLPLPGAATAVLARTRMRQTLAAVHGGGRPGFAALIADLTSGDRATAGRAADRLRDGSWLTEAPGRDRAVPVLPEVGTEVCVRLEERTLGLLVDGAGEYQFGGEPGDFAAVDAAVYSGGAGIGLELLHHRGRPGVDELLERLAAHSVTALHRVAPAPGLFSGRTGTEIFLAAARAAGVAMPHEVPPASGNGARDGELDVISGRAGVGLGALLLGDVETAHDQARRLVAQPGLSVLPPLGASIAQNPAFGYAHGFAGATDCLIAVAAHTDDPQLHGAARRRARALAERVLRLVAGGEVAAASPMTASWCRGLAGAARVLLHAHLRYGEAAFLTSAQAAASACAAFLPRMSRPGQCCGIAGVGSMLVDMARATGQERFQEAARTAARQLLIRSYGPDDAPLFVHPDFQQLPYSWSQGYAGVLAFLRRLNRPDTPEPLPSPAGMLSAAPMPRRTSRAAGAAAADG
ncbi:lanthionine synthetase LanC family protein [Streptomyces natalensis]|uniref:class III lanthionine synthetase LanKC N-terminal domain-containing protein n=1 Tax=Streptomyces natalensis TaxID=68242 RepID=UPI00069A9AC7|nr:lanthionine synthetase LanC family protein [Streptomyces natalensis]